MLSSPRPARDSVSSSELIVITFLSGNLGQSALDRAGEDGSKIYRTRASWRALLKVVNRIVPINLHACELGFECATESIDKTLSDVMIMHRLYVTDHSIIVMTDKHIANKRRGTRGSRIIARSVHSLIFAHLFR